MMTTVIPTSLQAASTKDIVQGTAAGVLLQLVLGAPFLVAAPASYLRKAFELSRVFLHQWTVNLHFLPEVLVWPIFVHPDVCRTLIVVTGHVFEHALDAVVKPVQTFPPPS